MVSTTSQRVFVLLSCTFLGLTCGTLYLYSSYSPQLAQRLHYSASDSSFIALLGTIGVAIAGPIAGSVVDKRGYTVSLAIGGLLIVGGYFGMKRQFDNSYSDLSMSGSFIFAIGLGSTFINSSCLKCCAITFPSMRGVATSLPLALYGLSALFYSVIASVFYPGDTSNFLGFVGYSIIIILIICAPSVIMADYEHKPKRSIKSEYKPTDPLSSSSSHLKSTNLFYNPKFWLIFAITGTLASLGQMYIYSVGYMVKALVSYTIRNGVDITPISIEETETVIQHDQQFQVGLLSIANCVGRILSGILGDFITQSFGLPRTWLLFFPSIGMTITQLLSFNIKNYSKLPVDSLLTGLFYGFTFCIMPTIVGDMFGMDNFSYNWGIVALAPIFPSYYFTSLFGKIYDSKSISSASNTNDAAAGTSAAGGLVCMLGNQCYNSIFKITFSVSILSIILVLILTIGHSCWYGRKTENKRIKPLRLASPSSVLPMASPLKFQFNEKDS